MHLSSWPSCMQTYTPFYSSYIRYCRPGPSEATAVKLNSRNSAKRRNINDLAAQIPSRKKNAPALRFTTKSIFHPSLHFSEFGSVLMGAERQCSSLVEYEPLSR